jgi:hypothetical protein
MNDQHHAVVTLPTVCAITKFNRLVLFRDETVIYCENGNERISTTWVWIIIIIIIITTTTTSTTTTTTTTTTSTSCNWVFIR